MVIRFRSVAAVLTLAALAACASAARDRPATPASPTGSAATVGHTVVVVVRHAEAERDAGGDPALTAEGVARAERLATVLGEFGIRTIHSTPLRRTTATAAPLAARLGLEPLPYDARDLEGLARRLRAEPGPHLVLGHSNTNPDLVAHLGGDPGPPIESHEHDRIYVLIIEPAAVRTMVVRLPGP